jgi:hypothetical protein
VSSRGQPSAKALRVGYLHPAPAEASIVFKIMVPRLRDLGYIHDRQDRRIDEASGYGGRTTHQV